MIKAMRTAASGMSGQQMNIDNIANNLANVNTTGFKKSKLEFQDVLYQNYRKAGTSSAVGATIPTNLAVGYGTKPVATTREFSVGDFMQTGNPMDLAISGNGFFQILTPDGNNAYTRDGTFKISAEGQVVTSDGFQMVPEVSVPEDANSISVSIDGEISVMITGTVEPQVIGNIEMARFVNPAGLSAVGHNLYIQTGASGEPILGTPSQDGLGKIEQGYLEMSNVAIVDEMVNMIIAQRAYEINSKVIQTSDDMSQIANNLKR